MPSAFPLLVIRDDLLRQPAGEAVAELLVFVVEECAFHVSSMVLPRSGGARCFLATVHLP